MKKIIVLFLALQAGFSFAQKSNVRAAYNYLKYDEIDKGKQAIDEAVVNEQTKNNDMAWYYRGLIYESIYKHAKFSGLDNRPLKTAYDSYRKALDIAPDGEFVEVINARLKILSHNILAMGIDEFNAKNYPSSLESCEYVLKISQEDTMAIYVAGLCESKLNNYGKAADYFSRLIALKHYDEKYFNELSTALLRKGDTAKSLEAIVSGRKIFPDNYGLLLAEINIYLPRGKHKEAIDLLKQAIAKDEKNESLYFALGNTYDNLRLEAGSTAAAADYFALAEVAYKKTIELKPDFSDAYFNLGILHFNKGEQIDNAANTEKVQAEYEKAKAKSAEIFGVARTYLEKARELSPKDMNILTTLKQLYIRTKENVKYDEVQKAIDALK